jgi:twitching motility protein PilT
MNLNIELLLEQVVAQDASDLHLLVGSPPVIRKDGRLLGLGNQVLNKENIQELVLQLVTEKQKQELLANKELDFAYQYQAKGRFRVNAYHTKGDLAAALRLIPVRIRTTEELNLPKVVNRFASLKQGLVLVTGPTGHGKSSTLAAVIDKINNERSEHIVTIEDPIEFIYKPKRSIISQREMKQDTMSWEIALRSVLREDPDVVLVGEMRDFETISAALTVAETGHLVFATLHTNSAAQTMDRIIDVFPEGQQQQVRQQLAQVVEGVFSQRLIPAIDKGRVPAAEVLLATPALRNTIREGKTHQIDNIIQTGMNLGMMTLENSLLTWVKTGKISMEEAQKYALRPEELQRLVRGS